MQLGKPAILLCSSLLAIDLLSGLPSHSLTAASNEQLPSTHNMLMVGSKYVFLSHLPMFSEEAGTLLLKELKEYPTVHRYQVIAEVTLTKEDHDITGLYSEDRKTHPEVKMYTLSPNEFALQRLIAQEPAADTIRTFSGTAFRGHLERGGKPIDTLHDINIRVNQIVHAHEFHPQTRRFKNLHYILFGKTDELFMVHYIMRPPDFDQLMAISEVGHTFTDDELKHGIEVTIPERPNKIATRLKEGEQSSVQARTTGARQFLTISLKADKELYLEEGELHVPATFDSTQAEREAGF